MSTVQTTTVLDKIRSRGYWRVVIRPTTFQERRIPGYADLFPIVEKCSVQLRVWGYPHIDRSRPRLRGDDWVGQEYVCEDEIEAWRIYLSGQFVHYFAMAEDWRDQLTFRPAGSDWLWGQEVDFDHTILSLRAIHEFAARLALSPAGAGHMRVEVDLHGIKGRRIVTGPPQWLFYGDRTEATGWKHTWEGPQTELIARPRELAALAAQDLFARFGMDVSQVALIRLPDQVTR